MAQQAPNSQATGSYVNHTYVRRDVTVYGVMEHEMDNLSTWNLLSSLFFAGSAASISFWATLFLKDQVSPERTEAGDVLITTGQPIARSLTIILALAGCFFLWKRGSTLTRIKKESSEVDQP